MITFTQARNIADYLLDSLYGKALQEKHLDPCYDLSAGDIDADTLESIWQRWGRIDGDAMADMANNSQLMACREEWDQLIDDPIAASRRVVMLLSQEWLEHSWDDIHDAIAAAVQERLASEAVDRNVDRYREQRRAV